MEECPTTTNRDQLPVPPPAGCRLSHPTSAATNLLAASLTPFGRRERPSALDEGIERRSAGGCRVRPSADCSSPAWSSSRISICRGRLAPTASSRQIILPLFNCWSFIKVCCFGACSSLGSRERCCSRSLARRSGRSMAESLTTSPGWWCRGDRGVSP